MIKSIITPAEVIAAAFSDGEYVAPEAIAEADIVAATERWVVPVVGSALLDKVAEGEYADSVNLLHDQKQGTFLTTMGYDDRTVELAKIAGYLHDIGNLVNRVEHSQSSAVMAFRILDNMGFTAEEISLIVTAIGNHDEGTGVPVNPMAAALILADKSDVRRSRVRTKDMAGFDIPDRGNYSVTESKLVLSDDRKEMELRLTVDTEFSAVMDYFEIFMNRMLMCRKAADALGLRFRLNINSQQML